MRKSSPGDVTVMICLRCGCCCIYLDVAIPNPDAIKPDGTLDESHPSQMVLKKAGERCPHLLFSGEIAVCRIHDMPCYKESPCDLFEQFGPEDDICILGACFRAGVIS